MEKIEKIYTGKVTNIGGREGHVKSEDSKINFKVEKPKEMGGTGEQPNPEQLFAAAYSSCFGSTLAAVAGEADVSGSEVTVSVHFGKVGGGEFGLAADIEVRIPKAKSLENAQELVEKAHEVCPYSKATRGNIEMNVKAIG